MQSLYKPFPVCKSAPSPSPIDFHMKHFSTSPTWSTGGTSSLGISCPMTESRSRTNFHIPASREKSRSRNMERNHRMHPKDCISRPMPECLPNTTKHTQDPFPHNDGNLCNDPLCISAPTPECPSGTSRRMFLRKTRCVLRPVPRWSVSHEETNQRNMERNRRMSPKGCISRPMSECPSNTMKNTHYPLLDT